MVAHIRKRIKEFKANINFKDFEIIPKIHCINPYDNEALCNIFNIYEPLINHEDDIEDGEELDKDEIEECEECEESEKDEDYNDYENNNIKSYKCKHCGKKININSYNNREIDFIKHLKNYHDYDDSNIKSKNTKIYKAYEFICKKIYLKFKDIQKLKLFYQFILNNIDINVYECSDLEYASKIFEWENNRGKLVDTLDVIKNILLSNIIDSQKYEIYDKWNKLKSNSNSIYSDYGQKIFNCAIQIYNNKVTRNFNQEELFKKLIKDNKNNTYIEINIFFTIVQKLFKFMENIKENRYGRLILHTTRCSISWEGYLYFMLPIFYFNNNIDENIIEIVTKWCYRNINAKNRVFNNLCYSNDFIELTNSYIKNNEINYYDELSKILKKNKDISVNNENYIKNNINKEWKYSNGTQAKMLLYYLETYEQPDDYKPNLDHDLEHIYPENKKNSLSMPNTIYYFGNLTILESKNSKNGQKGNRSIKDKNFEIKKEQYIKSIHKITRDIIKYESFDIDSINNRTEELFNKLNYLTDY